MTQSTPLPFKGSTRRVTGWVRGWLKSKITTGEEKSAAYPATPSGMPGVQTLVPVMLDHVNAGRLTLERLAGLISATPARLFGLKGKGGLVTGNDGDLTLVDMSARREITDDWIASKCGWTPFDGRTVTGWPVATVIRGRVVMREDEVLASPSGIPLRFKESA